MISKDSNNIKMELNIIKTDSNRVKLDITSIEEIQDLHQNKIKINSKNIDVLFEIHNRYFPIRETGKHCSSCRARVFKRVTQIILPSLKKAVGI